MLPLEPIYLDLALVVIAFLVAGTSMGVLGVENPPDCCAGPERRDASRDDTRRSRFSNFAFELVTGV